MGRRESNSPYWSGSRSWRHGCALPRVHPVRDAGGWAAPRKLRGDHNANAAPAWHRGSRPRPRLEGDGRAGSSVGLPSTWSAALGLPQAPGGSSPPSPAGLSFSVSWHRLLGPLQRAAAPPIRMKLSAGRCHNINRFSWLIQALMQGLGTRAPLSTSLSR
jgi:hypothetical protein